jgi:hypothetical protein
MHAAPQPPIEPLQETVDAWLQATRDVVLDERERGKVIDTKTAQITGFIGVILALDATLAVGTLDQATLRAPYATLLPALYLATVVLLIAAAVAANRWKPDAPEDSRARARAVRADC